MKASRKRTWAFGRPQASRSPRSDGVVAFPDMGLASSVSWARATTVAPVTLEEHIAQLNSLAFWREFTFARNKFSPTPDKELELADNLVWFGDRTYILQLKQRDNPSSDPLAERNWFEKKIIKKATSQIRDSQRYLDENPRIRITNEHGHSFEIERAHLRTITKIVVFLPAPALPEDCWRMHYHISKSTGSFIHLLPVNDYSGILETLRVPEDIARYFQYREEVTPRLREAGVSVEEPDIMGAFLNEEAMPTPGSHEILGRLVQDTESFDLSGLLGNLHSHIERADAPYEYYKILREFARSPRSVWREVKLRVTKSLEVTAAKDFARPFRLTFPENDCTFMIAPLAPELPSTGSEGVRVRTTGLSNLTQAAKYLAQTSKAVGIQISRDGEFVQIDWGLLEFPWQSDPELEDRLSKNNPFRPVTEKSMDGFFFKSSSS